MTKILLLISALYVAAAHAEEVTWEILALPPVAEVKDGKPVQGAVFELISMIEEKTPEIKYKYKVSSPNRILKNLEAGDKICTTLSLRNEYRDKIANFIPYIAIPPMQLFARETTLPKIPLKNGKVLLSELIKINDLRGVISDTRGYPNEITEIIDSEPYLKHITRLGSSSSGVNILSMISHGRYDYTVEIPAIVHAVKKTAIFQEELTSIPIDGAEKIIEIGIYCTKNEWGKLISTKLDKAIREILLEKTDMKDIYIQVFGYPTYDKYKSELIEYSNRRANTALKLEDHD